MWERWQSTNVGGFDTNYYLNKHKDVAAGFQTWINQADPNFGQYVRQNADLEHAWRYDYRNHPVTIATGNPPESRASWGKKHWDMWGSNENRPMAWNVSPGLYIMSRATGDQNQAKGDFAAWHFEHGGGKGTGVYHKSELDWYNSPAQQQKRQDERDAAQAASTKKFQDDLLAQQAKDAADRLRVQEEAAAKAARVTSSNPTGVGGAASIRGSRLSITEAGGRKGTKRFARPTEFMNTLGIGTGTASIGKSTLNL